ncbi:squalene/phytoene synthase family protein [Methylonatrum kenyense]|uniref:phytoene/squalene synthase family protein n=1 Tax=Methylonatrum kenyense TaxID=455253 RepID=UPI0020BE764D|nr:phytoene/squalene synthase family protein [Methylonatrum kenyense]MCK8515171.1 squalene/phytoene synthase family protein [Methylonatrum kenyense]
MTPESLALQDRLLPGVSRTFALTIPQLPEELRPAITNAYLLCRIADTVEDSTEMAPDQKELHYGRLLTALDDDRTADAFANALLETGMIRDPLERELIGETRGVLTAHRELPQPQQDALRTCLRTMCHGMARFEHEKNPNGLADRALLRDYCYVVAGCVGEMLTELFVDANPRLAPQRRELRDLAVAFGQGLQMTNILKDVWDDRRRGICWLPRDVFRAHSLDLETAERWHTLESYRDGIRFLVAVAYRHLQCARDYTLRIPAEETGIRRFCSWAIGMALYTLRNIAANTGFTTGEQVKISRRRVRLIVATCNLSASSDRLLQLAFQIGSRGLPQVKEQEIGRLRAGENHA